MQGHGSDGRDLRRLDRSRVAVSGGTATHPGRRVPARQLDDHGPDDHPASGHRPQPYRPGAGFDRPSALILWGRNPAWLLYDADFRELSRQHKGFSYLPVLRDAPPGWRGEKGECHEAVDRLVHSPDRTVVYVCGVDVTIKAVRSVLVAKGMDRKSVKWEKFW